MTRRFTSLSFVAALAALLLPRPAAACGGCFGPTGQATQVTAHRMAVLFGPDSTTLWDQFEYTGAPEDFVWVLPVAGDQDVRIELSDNAFFTALTSTTAIQLQGPFRPSSGGGGFGFGCGASAAAPAEMGPMSAVTVYGEEVVGPYETVTIGSEDPDALVTWLQDRGYGVPDDMLPTIAHYVDQGMNFVALRLSPDETVDRMQPVRVTTPGVNTAFPLRMVGAGVVGSVALELFVLGEGRYEAANFDNLEVDRTAIVYDWATSSYDYDARAQALVDESAGGGWLTEVANSVATSQLGQVWTADGEMLEASDDEAFVMERVGRTVFVTRMRADLPRDALREDLVLQASTGGNLSNFIFVENEVNFDTASSGGSLREASAIPMLSLGLLVAFAGARVRRRFL